MVVTQEEKPTWLPAESWSVEGKEDHLLLTYP
jgi:hypothetical protein